MVSIKFVVVVNHLTRKRLKTLLNCGLGLIFSRHTNIVLINVEVVAICFLGTKYQNSAIIESW